MNNTLVNGTNSSIPSSSDSTTGLVLPITFDSIKLILGLPINSYVLWLILSGAGGTIASEFFYLNLIASVILFILADVFYLAMLFTSNSILPKVYEFMFGLFYLFSIPSFQCCICVERYIAVVHPVVFLRYKALRYRVVCCCAVWLTALGFTLVYVLLPTVGLYLMMVFWVMCISVECFCCLAVLRALKQPGPGEGQRDSGEGNDLKRRAFRIILISLVIMLVTTMSFFPIAVLVVLDQHTAVTETLVFALATISAFVHPLLYIYKAGKLPCFKAP